MMAPSTNTPPPMLGNGVFFHRELPGKAAIRGTPQLRGGTAMTVPVTATPWFVIPILLSGYSSPSTSPGRGRSSVAMSVGVGFPTASYWTMSRPCDSTIVFGANAGCMTRRYETLNSISDSELLHMEKPNIPQALSMEPQYRP
ncbi:hypothetical protein VTN49DRAFT_2747 [Thermomyces lanuginosus]|uniref:uncharacterized protein n=1 Tax=Thermomyces lanuginosus TaxID=5541 RepID=UPI0037437B62